MKRFSKIFTCIMLSAVMASVSFAAGCFGGGDEHKHTYAKEWDNDKDYHWHNATCEHTDKVSGYGEHVFDGNICSVCNYDKSAQSPEGPVKCDVTFDANGGKFENNSSTLTVQVNKGDKLNVPETPLRDNYTFTHWYKESSLTTEWNFSDDVVTEITRLYAGWSENPPAVDEHDVTFVLNYAGAQSVVKSTVDGLITYIPERSGYTFNGWWISDGQTDSGEYILAQKWDVTEVVTEDGLVLYAEWVEQSTQSSQLPAPSVNINGSVFSWSSVDGAQGYNVRVYKAGSDNEEASQNVSGTSWTFPSNLDAGYYTVNIRAQGDGVNTVNSVYVSKSYAHNILSAASSIDFDITTSVLTWTAVKNATSYELFVNNEPVDELTRTTYDMSGYEAGSYQIKIVAKRTGYQSSTATKTVEKLRLKTPAPKIYVDGATAGYVVTWESVAHANKYKLVFNGTEVEAEDTSYSFNNSASFWQDGVVALTMTAFDDNADYLVSNPSQELTANKVYTLNVEKDAAGAGKTNISGQIYVASAEDGYMEKGPENGATDGSKVIAENNTSITVTAQTYLGYNWLGWYNGTTLCSAELNYTFDLGDDITLTAKWEVSTELGNLIFTSTATSCVVNGVKDNTVEEIIIPDYVTSIEQGALEGCGNLTSLTIPFVGASKSSSSNSSSNYFGYIFGAGSYNNNSSYVPSSLKTVVVTGGTSIGSYAFYNCYSLTSVELPEGLTTIGSNSFNSCYGLMSITIPHSVTTINSNAFVYCYKLVEVYNLSGLNIRMGETSNGYAGYYALNILSDASADSGIKTADDYLFYEGESVAYLLGYSGTETELVLPEDYNGGEYRIIKYAFYKNSAMTSVALPDSVTSIGVYAFYGCTNLDSMTLPFVGESRDGNTNTHFGYYFGATNYSLNSNYVPASLKTVEITGGAKIGNDAFTNCSGLRSVTIGGAVHTIGNRAFVNCSGLQNLIMEEGITVIESGAFHGCSKLEEITLPQSLNSIGGDAFSGCSSLESVVVPDGVHTIGDSAFGDCTSLESITLPFVGNKENGASYTNFGYIFGTISYENNSRYVPSSLKTVVVKGGDIADNAFYYCGYLKSITLGDGVTTIGERAFYNCEALTDITIGTGVTASGYLAFNGCDSLVNVYINDMASWCQIEFDSSDSNPIYYAQNLYLGDTLVTDLVIPAEVTRIASNTFYNYRALNSVTIHAGLVSVGYDAFYICIGLERVNIADLESWCKIEFASYGSNPLCNSGNLYLNGTLVTEVAIPDGLTAVNDYIFYNYSSLLSVTVPEGVTSIGKQAFYHCTNLGSVTLPESLTSIGEQAFSDCTGIASIVIPDEVIYIGGYAFRNCTAEISWGENPKITDLTTAAFGQYKGTSIVVPDSVTAIGGYTFIACTNLVSITLPFVGSAADARTNTHFGYIFLAYSYTNNKDSVPSSLRTVIITGGTAIAANAFYNCINIANLTIPDTVTSVGDNAFYGCTGIRNATIPVAVISKIPKSGLINVVINRGNSLPSNAFSGAANLESVTLPDSLTSIGSYAFSGCSSLQSITIPDGLTSLGGYAFNNCCSLESIVVPDGVSNLYSNTFSGCSSLQSIKLPFVGTSTADNFGNIFGASTYTGNADYVPTSLKTVIITGGTAIADNAFRGLSGLECVVLPDSITSIGSNAFTGCTGLADLTIPFVGASTDDSYAYIGYLFGASSRDGNATFVPASLTTVIVTGGETVPYNAFYNCVNLESVTIPASVTSIGTYAFYNCNNLREVHIADLESWCKIEFGLYEYSNPLYYAHDLYLDDALVTELEVPDGITSIKQFAFYGCSIQSVTLPDGVTSIAASAFYNCESLNSITLPDSVTMIGLNAFFGSGYYNNADNWPDDVLYIGKHIIKAKTELSGEYAIAEGTLNIAPNAFAGCTGLTGISIPDSVRIIGSNAFNGCSGLRDLALGAGVSSIGSGAFGGCTNLETITVAAENGHYYGAGNCIIDKLTDILIVGCKNSVIPETVTSIAANAFYNCTGITSITIPATVVSIGTDAFKGCTALQNVYITDIAGWCNIEFGNSYSNPLYYANNLYLDNQLVTELEIPDGVTTIGKYAFYNYEGLQSVIVTEGVTLIDQYAFYGCKSLISISIPESLASVGRYAFSNCNGLERVDITDLLKWFEIVFASSDANPLNYAHNLYEDEVLVTELTIPDSVTEIGDYTFYGGKSIESLVIHENVTTIGNNAFGYSGLVTITWNAVNCTTNGNTIFGGCSNVTEINIGERVKSIPDYAFAGCKGLTSVVVPDNVTSIGLAAFYYRKSYADALSNLQYLTLPFVGAQIGGTTNTQFSYIFGSSGEMPYSLKTVTITKETAIAANAFATCTSDQIILPDSLTSIGESAFRESDVEIIWGENPRITTIKENTFSGYYGTSLTIPDSVTTIEVGALKDIPFIDNLTIPFVGASINTNSFPRLGAIFGRYNYYDHQEGVPRFLKTVTVTGGTIAENAFQNCSGLETVILGDGVTSIGNYAFDGCSSLKSIVISTSVKNIGSNYTFRNCSGELKVYFCGAYGKFPYTSAYSSSDVYYYSEDYPYGSSGNSNRKYWHYDDETGEIVIWVKE